LSDQKREFHFHMNRSDRYFLILVLLSCGLFLQPLGELLHAALTYDYYSHILLIPAVSAFFIYWIERQEIFRNERPCIRGAAPLFALSAVLYWIALRYLATSTDVYLSLAILAVVTFWMAGFLLAYGLGSFRAATFPLLLLLLVVPLPEFLLNKIIHVLQQGSADTSHVLFTMVGVPVFRDGFFFTLPGLTVEVAEQCSGIRSSTALFILCLVVGHVTLRSASRKAVLLVSAIPILIFKNAVRIVVISLLSAYVSRDFLTGTLHQSGGVLFFLLGLILLVPILRLLEKSEHRRSPETEEA
jgi:exosortase